MILQTKRLIIRKPTLKDVDDLVKNINNLNVSQYLDAVPYPYKKKDAKMWIVVLLKKYEFVIEYQYRVVGAIGLTEVNTSVGSASIGYWLGEKYWGNRLMSEAVEKMLNFGFKTLKLQRIEGRVFVENIPSANLLEKFGFKREGHLRREVRSKATGKLSDAYVYGLLKEDYLKKK